MLSRSFSPSKISRFPPPPPPPPPSAPPPRNKNYRSHRQRQYTKDYNNAAPKDDHRPLPLPTITPQQDPPPQQMTARIEQPLEEYHMGHFDTIHIDPTVVTASSSDQPNISDDSSTSGAAWKMRLRHIFHRKQQQQQPDIYMNHVDVEHEPTGDDEGIAVRQNPRNDHSNDRPLGAESTEPQPPFDGIITTGLSSTDYTCNDNYHNEYIGDAQRYQRQRLFTRNKKRKAPFRCPGTSSTSMNHYIQNQELKVPFHLESDKAQPLPHQLEMSMISNSQTDQTNPPQLSENGKGSNRRVRNNDTHNVTTHHHPSNSSSDDNNGVLLLAADDPVSDFDDSEWTPMDSSYGAAIPLAGWIPKRIRRTIEFTVLLGLAALIVFLIVEKSVTSSNHNKSNSSSNNNIVNQVIDNYNGDDEVFYNYSNFDNTTINDDGDNDDENVNLR